MSSKNFDIQKTSYAKSTYTQVIDNSFTQLVPPPPEVVVEPTVDEFFVLYNNLFFDIPKTGEVNSHEFLVQKSTEYLDKDPLSEEFKALLEEVNTLRQQLLDANREIIELKNQQASENIDVDEIKTVLS
jgi:hypothetical protein